MKAHTSDKNTSEKIPPSRMRLSDLIGEALAAISARPSRAALTAIGTVIGVGTFVVILCLTSTIQSQVSSRFNAFVATSVTVEDARQVASFQPFPFTEEASRRVSALHGVVAEGVRWNVKKASGTVTADVGAGKQATLLGVTAATPSLWAVVEPHLEAGRLFDNYQDSSHAKVAVLGAAAAKELGVSSLFGQPAIFIGGEPYTVVGILESVRRDPDLLLSVTIPASSANARWGVADGQAGATMEISTRLGAAQQIASESTIATSMLDESAVRVIAPPDPKTLRNGINADLSGLFLALALICLTIGMVGIANTTLVAVVERIPEIGLRRALGARQHHIALQVITESALLGLVGGLVGSSLGIITVLAISLSQHWAPVVDPSVAFGAPIVGLVAGVVAGAYPAWRATNIEPTDALRR